MSIVVRSYDHGRSESVVDMGNRLFKLLSALTAAHAKLSGWRARASDGALTPIESPDECAQAISARRYTWKTGPKELAAYGPVVVAAEGAAEVAMVCGVEPLPVWTPNQTHVVFGASSGITAREQGTLEALLAALAATQAPAWGYVSVDGSPAAPMPPFADGTPVVGWITFLSRAYRVPTVLPEPAVVRSVEKGMLLVAHPTRPDVEAIGRLRAVLAEGGALIPAARARAADR